MNSRMRKVEKTEEKNIRKNILIDIQNIIIEGEKNKNLINMVTKDMMIDSSKGMKNLFKNKTRISLSTEKIRKSKNKSQTSSLQEFC